MPTNKLKFSGLTRGFTLVELSIVILVLAMFAAAVVPQMSNVKRGQEIRRFKSDLESLSSDARSRAMGSQSVIRMKYDEAESAIRLESGTEEEPTVVRTLGLDEDATPDQFRSEELDVTAAEWSIDYYSDGTCSGGGVQFSIGGDTQSYVIEKLTCRASWQVGELPPADESKWKAGELEVRG